ncbi:MAG TPA: glycosyltransferase family 2 protein [Accumulibacter sp.]|nr:glycosyltransferase family 2 protein [Accumulibacter sp.]HMW16268.1 glycosyltransferase family 2 protein [Accumulibacter sp.]HMX23121.1 glycosyltransferase family 2 protein [Accumulibacter sp.]HMY07027.1 glycosyltransferase family 2 protein [Accumulibacter sp.]HNC16779.1 glycosyltransferase family 2 protein [Accumulibacter sp.]
MPHAISVTILTKNSEKYLVRCLDALAAFDEVIVVDNGSTDSTMALAVTYPNVRLIEHPFIGFGPLKNFAVAAARNNWILSVDSDEIVTSALLDELVALDLSDERTVYSIARDNHYNGKLVRCCGWRPDRVLRVFCRTHTRFNDAQVHESLILKSETRIHPLRGTLQHFPYANAAELIEKMQKYSTLYAEQSAKRSSPAKAFFRASFAFIRNYVFQKGFLCGYEGLLISVSNAIGVFYKYIKLYEKNRR